MNRARTILALGLLAGGTGCTSLHRSPGAGTGAGLSPASEREPAVARKDEAPPPSDVFHPQAATPTERLARFFPGLMRPGRPSGAMGIDAKEARGAASPHDRSLEAVPRPAPDDEGTVTASVGPRPRAGAPGSKMGEAGSPRAASARGEARLTAGRKPSRDEDAPAQVLGATVVAETDPEDAPKWTRPAPRTGGPTPRPKAVEPPRTPKRARDDEDEAGRLAEARSRSSYPLRRMPRVPAANPPADDIRQAPSVAQGFAPIDARKPARSAPPRDRQALQARARAEDLAPASPVPAETTTLAMANPAPARAESAPVAPRAEDAPEKNLDPPREDRPVIARPEAGRTEPEDRPEASAPAEKPSSPASPPADPPGPAPEPASPAPEPAPPGPEDARPAPEPARPAPEPARPAPEPAPEPVHDRMPPRAEPTPGPERDLGPLPEAAPADEARPAPEAGAAAARESSEPAPESAPAEDLGPLPPAAPPSAERLPARAQVIPDEPPPIPSAPVSASGDHAASEADSPQSRADADPDAKGQPVLAGRRRLHLPPFARREAPGPDLPPVTFPSTYYGRQAPARRPSALADAGASPKVDAEARPARWSWTPHLFRRLKGEPPAAPSR